MAKHCLRICMDLTFVCGKKTEVIPNYITNEATRK